MDFLERDLEDIIHGSAQGAIRQRGLWCYSYDKVYRQVPLIDYGVADMITVKQYECEGELDKYSDKREIRVTIYEFKQGKIDASVMLQAGRYYAAAKNIVETIQSVHNLSNTKFTYSVVLVGRTIDTSGDFCFLSDLFENFSVYTYSYGFDGIKFKREEGYQITDCDLSIKSNSYVTDWMKMLTNRRQNHAILKEELQEPISDNEPF